MESRISKLIPSYELHALHAAISLILLWCHIFYFWTKEKWRKECTSVCFYKLWDWPVFLFACEYLISFKDYLCSSFQEVLFIAGVVERASKELSRRFTSFTSRSRKVSKHEKLEEHSFLTVSNIWNNSSSKTNKNTHKQRHTPHKSHVSQHFS